MANGVLLLENRSVIPDSVLRLAHEGHPGMNAFLDTLKARVWWPGQTKDATTFIERCVYVGDDAAKMPKSCNHQRSGEFGTK